MEVSAIPSPTHTHANRAVAAEYPGVPCRVRGGSLSSYIARARRRVPGERGVQWVDVLAKHECPAITARRAERAQRSGAHACPHIAWGDVNASRVSAAHPHACHARRLHSWEASAERNRSIYGQSCRRSRSVSRARDGSDRQFHPARHISQPHFRSLAILPTCGPAVQRFSRVFPGRSFPVAERCGAAFH